MFAGCTLLRDVLIQGCTSPGCQVTVAAKFCTLAHTMCGSSVCNWLLVTFCTLAHTMCGSSVCNWLLVTFCTLAHTMCGSSVCNWLFVTFCTLAHTMCGSSVWNWLLVTFWGLRILRWLPDFFFFFWKILLPLGE